MSKPIDLDQFERTVRAFGLAKRDFLACPDSNDENNRILRRLEVAEDALTSFVVVKAPELIRLARIGQAAEASLESPNPAPSKGEPE